MHAWRRLPSPQRRGRGAGEDRRNTRNIPSRDCSISPPAFTSMVSLFHRPVLEIISYRCFILLSFFFFFFFFCCCSDETFSLMLKLLLVFCDGCSALSFLPPRTSLLRGRGEDKRGWFGGGHQGWWFPNMGLGSIWSVTWYTLHWWHFNSIVQF